VTTPTELFANNFQTTLTNGLGTADTTAAINDTLPPALQASGEFRMLIGSSKTGELVVAQMGGSSTTLTLTRGAEGSTVQSWAVGTPVQQVLTAGGLSATISTAVGASQVGANVLTAPYNAPNNGTSDDGPAFNAAIAAVSAAGGGFVRAPGSANRYKLLSTVNHASNVTIIGDGPGTTILDASAVGVIESDHYYGVRGLGALGTTSYSITQDVHVGDMEVFVGSAVSNFTAGQWVLLSSAGPQGTVQTAINSSASTIVVTLTANTAAFSECGQIVIGNERIAYSSVSVTSGVATFTVRSGPTGRGYQGTAAASHSLGATVQEWHQAKYTTWTNNNVYNRGELKRVSSITASTLIFDSGAYDDYPIAYATTVTPVATMLENLGLKDLTIDCGTALIAETSVQWGAQFQYCDNIELDNVVFANFGDYGVDFKSATNWSVSESCTGNGKTQNDASGGENHSFYFVSASGPSQWGRVAGHAQRSYKQFTSWCTATTPGIPRFIDVVCATFTNSGTQWVGRHPAYEVHSGGEHINFIGVTADSADSLISIQAGRHITVDGLTGTNWFRAGVILSEASMVRDITVKNCDLGRRTRGAGYTTLTANVASGDTTINVASTAGIYTDSAAVIEQLVLMPGGELILPGGFTSTTLTGCTRGFAQTTATSYSSGGQVLPGGSSAACPIDVDFTMCVWGNRAYGQPITLITASMLSTDTTATLTDATNWPASGTLIIEGENSSRNYEPEICGFTLSGSTLTLTRGQCGTPAVAHSQYCFIQPYEPAVKNITIEGNVGTHDWNYYAGVLRGYVPTHNVSVRRNKLYWGSTTTRCATNAFVVQSHGVAVEDNQMDGFSYAIQSLGNNAEIEHNKITLSVQETVGGYAIETQGTGATVKDNRGRNCYVGLNDSGTGTRALENTFDVPFTTRLILSSGTGLVARNNRAPSVHMSVTAAATLTLPCAGNFTWFVSGGTAVTSIPADSDGTEIKLVYTSAGSVTSGSNLILSGNFVPVGGGSLTLVCNGTNWYETARAEYA
jgi:hypothetical protein